jgi:hypothetical protein
MSVAPWIKPVRLAVYAATLAVGVIGATGKAAWAQQAATTAEDDDLEDSILNADKKMLNAVLGTLGLRSTAPDIEYRERSPLVVPKGSNLPPPGKVVKSGDWPIEPEVKEKRKAAALRKAGKDPVDPDPAIPISGSAENYKTGNTGTWAAEPDKTRKEPEFLKMLMSGSLKGDWNEVGKFEGEPPRASLAQPPAGYLTPSPAAPYGVTPRAGEAEKKEPKL